MASDSDILTTLFKKNQGYANTGTAKALNQEAILSEGYVSATRLALQAVPSLEPSDLITDSTWTNGTRKYSTASPWIVKYTDVPLAGVTPDVNSVFSYQATSVNVLKNALLPSIVGGTTQYSMTIYKSNGTTPINKANYIFDRDAGVLTYYPSGTDIQLTSTAPPKITFWRYEGTFMSDSQTAITTLASNQDKIFSEPLTDPSRVALQTTPSVEPSPLVIDTTWTTGGARKTNVANPYIVKYEAVPLTSVGGSSTKFEGSNKLLRNAILPTDDGQYLVSVTDSSSPTAIGISSSEYIVDRDAGTLTYYPSTSVKLSSTNLPKITFWRYEGTFMSDGIMTNGGNIWNALLPSAPSAVTLPASQLASVGSEITLQWTNPTTIALGPSLYLPSMTSFVVKLTDNSSTPKTTTITRTAASEIPSGVGSSAALTALAIRNYGGAVVSKLRKAQSADTSPFNTLFVDLSTELAGFTMPLKAEIWLENASGAGKKVTLTGLNFTGTASPPLAPTINASASGTEPKISITPSLPPKMDSSITDSTDPRMPDFSKFTISYKPVRSKRYGGSAATDATTLTDLTTTQVSIDRSDTSIYTTPTLYYDTTYDVSGVAYNAATSVASPSSTKASPWTMELPDATISRTYLDTAPAIAFTSPYTNNIYPIGSSSQVSGVLYASSASTDNAKSSDFEIAILTFANRGSGATSGIGVLEVFTNNTGTGTADATFTFKGYPVSRTEANVTGTNICIYKGDRSDIVSSSDPVKQGYFIKQKFAIGLKSITASATQLTYTLKQNFDGTNNDSTKPITFYSDNVNPAANPGLSSATAAMTTTPTNICGLKIYGSSISYTIHTIQCSNISNIFTTSDTLTATLLGTAATADVVDKVTSITAGDILLNGIGNQQTMAFSLPSSYNYTTTGTGVLTLKNTTADSSKNTGTYTFVSNLKIIVDPASITEFLKHTRITTPSAFATLAASFTDFSHSAALPDGELLLCNGYYIPTSYNQQSTITEYNSNYDAAVSATGSALNYSVKTGVTKLGLTTYQFVTLKKSVTSLGSGSNITLFQFSTTWGAAMSVSTYKSGSSTKQVTTPEGSQIGIWYKLVQGSIETRWIDANSDINKNAGYYTDTDYTKDFGGAWQHPQIVDKTLTNYVLTPSLNRTTQIDVYIMIGVPSTSTTAGFTNLEISFV